MKMNMKKQLLLLAMMFLPMVASAYDIAVENADGVTIYYNYINNGNELEVTLKNYYGYNDNYQGDVVIPEEVTFMSITRKVTSIGNYAFRDCSGLTSVSIPNSVTSIDYEAFENCKNLTSVTIPNSVTFIGEFAFYNCSGLISVTIPSSLTSIKRNTFKGCSGLTSVTIPNSVTYIGDYAFCDCSSLTTIEIPNSVTAIGYEAFQNTPWYNNQPDGLVYAGKVAYKYKGTMPANTDIVIEDGTVGIADYAFRDCSGLTSVTIPIGVTSIGWCAFADCSGLTSVTIPNSVTYIGDYAFRDCSSLTSVTIGNSVTSIRSYAFQDCTNLKKIESFNPEPPQCVSDLVFLGDDFTAPLYVPKGSVLKYKAAPGWRQFVIVRELDDENNDIYLTINDGAHGNVKLKIDESNPYVSLKFEAENGWQVYSLMLNGENVTEEMAPDGTYITPAINSNSLLTVVYSQGSTSVPSYNASRIQLSSNGNSLVIDGTAEGDSICIYTIDGKCIVSKCATSSHTEVPLEGKQTYILRVNNQNFKFGL